MYVRKVSGRETHEIVLNSQKSTNKGKEQAA